MSPREKRALSTRLPCSYLEPLHLAAHGQHVPRSLDVRVDGFLQLLVEAHRGRRVEDDRDVLDDELQIRRREPVLRQSDVSGQSDHFAHHVRLIALHGVKDLEKRPAALELAQSHDSAESTLPGCSATPRDASARLSWASGA